MGIQGFGLADALFDDVQQRVMGILFIQSDASFSTNELIRLAKSGSGAVQRLMAKLTRAGLVSMEPVGNQKRYKANLDSPIFSELQSIAQKTFGLAGPLRFALEPVRGKIKAAFVFGSVAKRLDSSKSDVDLLVISNKLTYADLYALLIPAEATLLRPINPRVYTPAEWHAKIKEGRSFATRIVEQPKIFIIGAEADITRTRESGNER
ncbi:MAG: nucleotidyltransferase domain-containing protein [Gemmatimonadaceae bacterium]|nr:nucleotidyltransferase domain-containing protein [Gemmatimonadaceae bacterium]